MAATRDGKMWRCQFYYSHLYPNKQGEVADRL